MCQARSDCPRTEFRDGACSVHYVGDRECIRCGESITDDAERCETLRCDECSEEWERDRSTEAASKGLDGLGNRMVPR